MAGIVIRLSRIHAVHGPLAQAHAASAPGLDDGIAPDSDLPPTGAATASTLLYSVTWMGIGSEPTRWLPSVRSSTPPAACTPRHRSARTRS